MNGTVFRQASNRGQPTMHHRRGCRTRLPKLDGCPDCRRDAFAGNPLETMPGEVPLCRRREQIDVGDTIRRRVAQNPFDQRGAQAGASSLQGHDHRAKQPGPIVPLKACRTDQAARVLGHDEPFEVGGNTGGRKAGVDQKLNDGGQIVWLSGPQLDCGGTTSDRCSGHTHSGFRARINAPITQPPTSRASTSSAELPTSCNAFGSSNR